MRYFGKLLLIIAAGTLHAAEVDHVLVKKSERQLLLMSGTEVVKSYPISLGEQPVGHKQREGDEKTPEGQYVLDWRNPDSRFYKSIRISYPNDADELRARRNNQSPGGDIFIHGLPNGLSRLARAFKGRNWTDGCIAVNNNDHMEEIWQLVKDGTKITIRP
ncbi:MAG: L,D-transpeptidase family protein [Pseudomonadaceae bacterium]|nr:L,D-transpeptidase family protein [Pseudomonadaceae bacterium]